MTDDDRKSLLSSLATHIACTICHQEAYGDHHHGNYMLDLHHAPVLGPVPLSGAMGRVVGWWYYRDGWSQFVDFVHPDGHQELVLLRDGKREDWTLQRKEAQAMAWTQR